MRANEFLTEDWSQKYKNSINCSHPKGFSQRAHCAGKKKHNEDVTMEQVCPDCGMCQTHSNLNEIRKGQKDANGYTRCWPGKHAEGTKKGRNGGQVRNCVPNESIEEAEGRVDPILIKALNNMPNGLATHHQVLDAAYDAYAMELGKLRMKSEYGTTREYIPKLMSLYKDKHGLTFNENTELAEEFDLIESIIEDLAESNGVDSEVIWEDLESLDDDELYVFATTSTIMETEAWQKANNRDRTDGMSRKAVKTYRREHPGSKLQTAVTTKPSKLKKGSKASKRRKSYCSRSRGQMKMHNISCAKTPDKAICKARRRWNC
jgi:hypothetical protein